MDLEQLHPIQIKCPHCEKKYLVATKSLTLGEARFQCTSCEALFAIQWNGHAVGEKGSYLISKPQKFKPCPKCSYQCPEEDKECRKCGVVFVKEAPQPIRITSKIPELAKRWEQVRKNYHDDNEHFEFIRLCATHDQLVYASQQYKAILIVNPSEPTAQRMQKVLLEMIQAKKDHQQPTSDPVTGKVKMSIQKILIFTCLGGFLSGIAFESFRPMIALSSSILFFIIAFKFWVSKDPHN